MKNSDMSEASSSKDQKIPRDSAALARKRRIEMRNRQRSVSEDEAPDSGPCAGRKRAKVEDDASVVARDATASPPLPIDPVTCKPKPSLTGIKKHSRYDPGVPMNREELKAWRKEARRVRNRESAAASRKRNRERIDELESEVDALKSKYAAALQRIVDLEASAINDSFTPQNLRQDILSMNVLPSSAGPRPTTPEYTPFVKTVSPPMSPNIPPSHPSPPESPFHLCDEQKHTEEVNQKYQHIMDMISRPIAVKISGAGTKTSDTTNDFAPSFGDVAVVPPSVCSTSTVADSDMSTDYANSDTRSDVDDPELGAFLLDAFDGLLENPPSFAV